MEHEFQGDRVTLCPDGVYRWVYAFPMLKNPTLMFTIWKILAIAGCVPALVVTISDFGRHGLMALVTGLEVFGVVLLITAILSVIAYVFVAANYGWYYVVVFEMNEEGILHAQQKKQITKAKAMGMITALLGGAGGKMSTAGAGILAAAHTTLYSNFANVRKVVGLRKRHVIKVHEPFSKNQVYVTDEDYDFVWNYITSRCPQAKIK